MLFMCRYLVDVRWMKQWKKFVGYDTWDRSQVGEDSANPGPIDNKSLLAGEGCVCVCTRVLYVYVCLCAFVGLHQSCVIANW